MTILINLVLLSCAKAEIKDLTVCILVNGEKFQSHAVTLTLIGQCPMSNSSKLLSYATICSSFKFSSGLNHYFSSYRVHRQTNRQTDTHTHTQTHTHRRTPNFLLEAFHFLPMMFICVCQVKTCQVECTE